MGDILILQGQPSCHLFYEFTLRSVIILGNSDLCVTLSPSHVKLSHTRLVSCVTILRDFIIKQLACSFCCACSLP